MVDLEEKVNELDKKLDALISALYKKTAPEIKLFPSAYIKDSLGREYNDDLTGFMLWYLNSCSNKFQVPFENPILFAGDHTSCTLFRHGPYQVELVTVKPNGITYGHRHPDVDNYLVYLTGATLMYQGEKILTDEQGYETEKNGKAFAYMNKIRVKPNELHGGEAGPRGSSFLTVQKWLSGIAGQSIANNWDGEFLSEDHKIKVND